MKNSLVPMTALLTLGLAAAHAAPLPFVGTRTFNFMGGNGTEYNVRIAANGHTVVKFCGSDSCSVLYKGKFTNPMYLKEDREYLRFRGNMVYQLDHNQKVMMGCRDEQQPCASELY